jgi:hypothetical protein
MPSRVEGRKLIPYIFWILAIAAVPAWCALDPGNGWDAKVYLNAIHTIQAASPV